MSVQYHDVGTRVDVTPKLLRNGRIRLSIATEISEADATDSVEVAGTSVPRIRKRSIESEVELPDGGTAIVPHGIMEPVSSPQTERVTIFFAHAERLNVR